MLRRIPKAHPALIAGVFGATTGMLPVVDPAAAALTVGVDRDTIAQAPGSVEIGFDADAQGLPLSVNDGGTIPPGGRLGLAANEYASLGLEFDDAIEWVFDDSLAYQTAQISAGTAAGPLASPDSSGHIAIPGDEGSFSMVFSIPLRSIGFVVIADALSVPSFTFRDEDGQIIATSQGNSNPILFQSQGDLVDGTVGGVSYGFVGVSAEASTPIATVEAEIASGIIDDLIFAVIPAPATSAAVIFAAATVSRRRRSES